MAKKDINVFAGSPAVRGASYRDKGTNFALFSAHATGVDLCLFDKDGKKEKERIPLPEFTDGVWHGFFENILPGTVYGYRAHGPFEPEAGHRYNPSKLLVDPYARALKGKFIWNPACFGYRLGDPDADLSYNDDDSAPYVPKSVVTDSTVDQALKKQSLRTSWDKTILYELHVKGFTAQNNSVPKNLRGTYEGLSSPAVIDYLKNLGITSLNIQPVHAFIDESHLLDKGLCNYWGYNTLNFFSAERRYARQADTALQELKKTIAALHDAGMEVILDVVYNHTAEGNELGPTISFRGIDNASYYRLQENPRYYTNDSGTGNTLNISHPRVLQMVMDSLRYWVSEVGVDGFRFDLGTVLARTDSGFDPGGNFLAACLQDPVLANVKFIAEPWDCGPDGYQAGSFPPGWAEWNDRFRDTVRDFWRQKATAGALAPRLCASEDIYNKKGRRPFSSINFITAHDGFSLHDLVSYNDRHNKANDEDNNDGHSDNRSWNCGVEGPTDDEPINTLRLRQMKNFLATLFLSQGTPMLQAGDEMACSRSGNNNVYCQDNPLGWVAWDENLTATEISTFTRHLVDMRQAYRPLRRPYFLTNDCDRNPDIIWLNEQGTARTAEEWEENPHFLAILLPAQQKDASITGDDGAEAPLLIIFNAGSRHIDATLPSHKEVRWRRLIDTNLKTDAPSPDFSAGGVYSVTPHSLLFFVGRKHDG